ncbi:MAG: SPFH domain-containing protein [Candidatus Wallbacteria bacterium]|nr:SPFH domain-containing protein [Candidatus Wallbacteria bacterium]
MFGVRYMKATPTTYVMHYKEGRIVRSGVGLSFFYFAPTSSLVAVSLASRDVPFAFNETTGDFQSVTIQGQLTFRVVDAPRVAGTLDFSIRPDGSYLSDDPAQLQQRLVHATQILARAVAQRMPLREALVSSDALVREVLAGLRAHEVVTMLGLEILALSVLSIRPTPDMARALEAEAREGLQRRADEAIYARRNAAVEQERTIKESELATELAIEAKKRQIREAQMAAEIAVEEQRSELMDRRVANDRKEADGRAYSLEATLKPLRETDWRTLTAVSSQNDSRLHIALAFRELAENAQKIGELSISPELLDSLVNRSEK